MKVVIAGGTGFIGSYLAKRYKTQGHDVYIISRNKQNETDGQIVTWTDISGIEAALSNADLLINMAGKSVDCRYHSRNRKEILDSRINTTRQLNSIIYGLQQPPKLWVNSSTATIYRHAEDRPMTESNGDIGSGFSVNVAKSWEQEFFSTIQATTRKVAIRTAIVLGEGGGAFAHFKMLTKIGFGGKQGNGRQMVSFVHVEDVYRAIEFIRTNKSSTKVYNVSAPEPVTNGEFMRAFRNSLGISFGMPIHKWTLTIGAFVLQTETELLLKSRWVLPDNLQQQGFVFKYPDIQSAVSGIISEKR